MDKDFQAQFDKAITERERLNQYRVTPIPQHIHNGSDSDRIAFESLINSNNYMAFRTTTLTAAQIKALNTTSQVLVPAIGGNSSNVGVNYVTIVEGITARMYYGGTAYGTANPLRFSYSTATGQTVSADLPTTFLTATANTFAHSPGLATAFTPYYNAPIVVSVPTANPGTGNSNITFVVKYRIVQI